MCVLSLGQSVSFQEGSSHLNIPIDHQGLISRLLPTAGAEPSNLDSDAQTVGVQSGSTFIKFETDSSNPNLDGLEASIVIPKPDPDNIDPNYGLHIDADTGIHPDTLRALVEQLRAATPMTDNVEQIIIIETQQH